MDIERFRDYCLSLGEVEEKMPFGKFAPRFDTVLVFYVKGHMFCLVDIADFSYAVVKNTPEAVAELHATRSSCCSMRNLSARHWIQLNFGGDITDAEILRLVAESYAIVKAKYTKK